ncbi:MAG: peptidoglycan DD-metalloendopeptidase family protein, partial [Arenibacter algicola]|nr:peptidoglycan DD-metalloendopeptidase family protein [Arenibacter algicola]
IGSISKARGRLPFPVVGRVVGLYGQPLEGNMTRKGLSVDTRPGAQVIAPFDGTVAFAGPFRGYGQLLIIDHGEGYHSLLAGLGRIDVSMGLAVLAGEPVAIMPGGEGSSGGDGGESVLYVEFRRDNQPFNPLPWLASRKGTPQG